MQPLNWYLQRLATMSKREISWRVAASIRDRADRLMVGRRRRRPVSAALPAGADVDRCGFRVTDVAVGAWASAAADDLRVQWLSQLTVAAEKIATGKLSFFDLVDCDLGAPIDWNRDHKHGRPTPMTFASGIDYRDFAATGDCKFVWEPSRHHHLVVLARAYRAGGDLRYARAVVEQLTSWLDQCPYGLGMQWRSGLELAIRLINWVWALDLIAPAAVVDESLRLRLLKAVDLHLWEIARKYSRGSSANNHLVGEAAGVFIAAGYFSSLARSERLMTEARRILREQIIRQSFPDGGGREQAMGYQRFTFQFFLAAGLAARRMGRDFPDEYWAAVDASAAFAGAFGEGGDEPWVFGDCDDGYVLDLGGEPGRVEPWLVIAAAIAGRADAYGASLIDALQPAAWMLAPETLAAMVRSHRRPQAKLTCRAFPDAGYYLLQSGSRGRADRISVGFDCGSLGFESIAAHGHADALSVTVRAFGTDLLVDPGTYDYFSYPRWRNYFRSTRAHNTVEIDRQDQSVMAGLFLWTHHARAWCARWEPTSSGGRVVGEHDGYARLDDPVAHRRTVELDADARAVVITDQITAGRSHDAAVCFHFSEHCRVRAEGENRFAIELDGGSADLEMDPTLDVQVLTGSEDPIGGWVSRGYHQKTAAASVIGRRSVGDGEPIVCRLRIGEPKP